MKPQGFYLFSMIFIPRPIPFCYSYPDHLIYSLLLFLPRSPHIFAFQFCCTLEMGCVIFIVLLLSLRVLLSANRVDFGLFLFHKFSKFTPQVELEMKRSKDKSKVTKCTVSLLEALRSRGMRGRGDVMCVYAMRCDAMRCDAMRWGVPCVCVGFFLLLGTPNISRIYRGFQSPGPKIAHNVVRCCESDGPGFCLCFEPSCVVSRS